MRDLGDLKRATFVGEESGGGYCGNTSGLSASIVLPNSKLRLTIPMWGYWNAVAETADKHRGTLPDHPVETEVVDRCAAPMRRGERHSNWQPARCLTRNDYSPGHVVSAHRVAPLIPMTFRNHLRDQTFTGDQAMKIPRTYRQLAVSTALVFTVPMLMVAISLRAGEIHDAAAAGNLNKVKALLAADPALLESKDNSGFTAHPTRVSLWAGFRTRLITRCPAFVSW